MSDTRTTSLTDVTAGSSPRDESVWDALWSNRSIGRIAVAIAPSKERTAAAKDLCASLDLNEPSTQSPRQTEQWREALIGGLASVRAGLQLPGDSIPALHVPRFVHGQSQGICDLFGAEVEPQDDGLFYVHPLRIEPEQISELRPRPLETGMSWGAVEWIRYARAATDGLFAFRNPVMTGPFDTANYLLGTTTLMEWVYDEPGALHTLLEKITDVMTDMIAALRDAAGGTLCGDAFQCMRSGFCLCSESRSIVSREVYEEFEAPYLCRLGERLGPYGVHSCGSWERTVPSALEDPNLRAMNGQVRENDLSKLCGLAQGNMTFSIGPSSNLSERYTWPDIADFYAHILRNVPDSQPIEISVAEGEVSVWNDLCKSCGREHNCLPTDFD